MRPLVLFAAGTLIVQCHVFAQQRPLRTDDAELVKTGRVRIEFGMEFLQGQQFPLSGLEGDLTRVGVTSIHVGMGEYAEFQLSGVIQNFLSVTERIQPIIPPDFSGNSTSDFGDLVLATKLRLAPEKGARPALAFKFAVQLPNANNESGLGTDTTDFFASALMGKTVRSIRVVGNVGVGILADPTRGDRQNDVVTFGVSLARAMTNEVELVGEINGRANTRTEALPGTESRGIVKFGARYTRGPARFDAAALMGMTERDPSIGFAVGVTYIFNAFKVH